MIPMYSAVLLLASLGRGPEALPSIPAPSAADASIAPARPLLRRDPFLSLLASAEPPAPQGDETGLPGLRVAEVVVRGVVHGRSGALAMVEGADRRTYIVRPGSRLRDGTVTSIGDAGIVVERRVEASALKTTPKELFLAIKATEGTKP